MASTTASTTGPSASEASGGESTAGNEAAGTKGLVSPTSNTNGALVSNGKANAACSVVNESNGKVYKNYNNTNLKDIIKRNKNEVSFEETVSLLGEDDGDHQSHHSPNPSLDDSNNNHHRRVSILSNKVASPTANGSIASNQQPHAQSNGVGPSAGEAEPNLENSQTKSDTCDSTSRRSSSSSGSGDEDSQSSANSHLRFSLPLTSSDGHKNGGASSSNGHVPGPPSAGPMKSILSNSHSQASTYRQPKDELNSPNRPPDGGWGWVVVFASFMMNLISDGVSLSFGVLFPVLVDVFGESKSKTSWVGSLFLSIPLLTGPIASALTDHFGCRKVAIAGAILSALGFVLGGFATNIAYLCFTFSLSGFGIALCQVAAIVCVAYYFEKRRSLATGLSVCGTGFGTFIFPPLTEYLLITFGWQVTLFIMAGIFLLIILFAFLVRDLDLDSDSDSEESSSSSSSEDDSTSDIESNVIDSEMNSIAEEDEGKSDNESESEHRHHSHKSSALSCIKGAGHDSSNESLASNNQKRISFNKSTRMRHISECEPDIEMAPRTCSSLINIPTYIKNSSANYQNSGSGQHNGTTTTGEQHNTNNGSTNDSIGELTFRRGGYLHNLITYYPHLLSLFLPWNLECNDLTVKTVPTKSPERLAPGTAAGSTTDGSGNTKPTNVSDDASETDQHQEDDRRSHLQVDFITPPPSPTSFRESDHELSHHHQDSVAIPVPTPPSYPEFNFRPTRVGGVRGLASSGRAGRGHRHRLHQHQHLNNDLFGNYLHNLRLQRGSLTYRSAMLIISKYKLKASSAPDIYRTSMATINETKGSSVWENIKDIFRDMIDVHMFKNLPYTIFCLSNFLLYVVIDIPYVYLPDQATTSGTFDKEGSSFLISIVGIFTTMGVVFVGYIGDKPWLDASMIYAVFIAVSGAALGAIPMTSSGAVVSTFSALYGFAISANYSLVSVILVEFITLDSFTQAYGMLLLLQGVGSLVGPPIAGWLFDIFNTYSQAFYLTGICGLISGLLVFSVGNRRNCCLWSYRMSRSGSSISLAFRPLTFIKAGVNGSTVCSKRNTNPVLHHQPNGRCKEVIIATPETSTISMPPPVHHKSTTNGHHVVIFDDEDTSSSCGAAGGADDDDSKRQSKQHQRNTSVISITTNSGPTGSERTNV